MADLLARLADAIGPDAVKSAPEDLAAYSFDGFSQSPPPRAVVLPAGTKDVCAVVRIARACGEPIVARGAGTGLCGASTPTSGGVVVSFARMNRVLQLDAPNRRARVQPGLINLDLSHATKEHGLFYAPDPSSQKISTIGGNVGTNAGGPHCLSYGTTTNHVLGLEIVDECGDVCWTSVDEPGYDLTGVLVGSEGTLALTTAIDVRLMRVPEDVRVFVAAFADVEAASACVSAIIAAGLTPTALEIMDALITRAVEHAFHAGYPTDAGAVLLVEIAGAREEAAAAEETVGRLAREDGALSWRAARTEAERAVLWAGRKGAAGAVGQLAPNYYIQDACVPRTRLPQALHAVCAIAAEYHLQIGNVFHAGDGNLHPLMLFDRRDPRSVAAIFAAGSAILEACIALGGTISGEHGIGHEKRDSLRLVFSSADLATMGRLRSVFDPSGSFNPDKIFPSGAGCAEVRR